MAEILTGARARFSLNGVKVGFATGVSVRETINYEAIETLDNVQVDSHEPVGYIVAMTADKVRIIGDTIKSRNWFPKQGTDPAAHLLNILTTGELTATIEDTITNTTAMHVEGVKISERNVQINARGVVGTNVSMVAKRARDESDLS